MVLLQVELEPADRVGRRLGDLLDRAEAIVESVNGTPAAAAARTVASSASGCASSWTDIGAIASGMADGAPAIVVAVLTRETVTSTRGRKRRRSQAASFSARVTSSHDPPAM